MAQVCGLGGDGGADGTLAHLISAPGQVEFCLSWYSATAKFPDKSALQDYVYRYSRFVSSDDQ
jgi:hypothetical protein